VCLESEQCTLVGWRESPPHRGVGLRQGQRGVHETLPSARVILERRTSAHFPPPRALASKTCV
jgi:hypothetical protein